MFRSQILSALRRKSGSQLQKHPCLYGTNGNETLSGFILDFGPFERDRSKENSFGLLPFSFSSVIMYVIEAQEKLGNI